MLIVCMVELRTPYSFNLLIIERETVNPLQPAKKENSMIPYEREAYTWPKIFIRQRNIQVPTLLQTLKVGLINF